MSDHERGTREGNFCSLAAEKPCADCGQSENYIEICEPQTSGWTADYAFARLVNSKIKPFVFAKKFEAHHVACVAPVTGVIAGDSALQDVVHQTKWCINKQSNMLAMPLWGHTVKWYCRITMASAAVDIDGSKLAPPFKNIPQHDFDHNCKEGYTWEVEEALKKLAEKCKKANKEHKLKEGDLAALLDRVSKGFKAMLDSRGNRKGGTHEAWGLAQEEPPDKEWCHPFSMASNSKVSSIGFPVKKFDEKVARWVARIARAMKGP
jgi:hypothetical protein